MKKNILLFIIFFACISLQFANSQQVDSVSHKKKLIKENLLGANPLGNEFIIAIPPNDRSEFGDGSGILEIYVASIKPTTVKISVNGSYVGSRHIIKPFGVVVLGKDFINNKNNEIRKPETAHKNTISIYSDDPISVYFINSKSASTDGYMALPVSSWGTAYTNCSYYENAEGGGHYNSGFVVIGAYDDTEVSISLKGVGKELGKTSTGRKIGDKWKVTIHRNEVYQVCGDGLNRGDFDMTGTLVTSTKPIGFLSYHERSPIPINSMSSRDHLIEMIPPNTSLGKHFYSIEFKRSEKKGDFYRIVAAEDNTKYEIVWYDIGVLGHRNGILKQAGDFVEIPETKEMYSNNELNPGVRRLVEINTDKGALVVQYATSSIWGGSPGDPFMVVVTPREQFLEKTVFQAPSNKTFMFNYFNILAVGDTADYENHVRLINSIEVDGQRVVDANQSLLKNRIPNTDIYYVTLTLSSGPHYLQADTKCGGYVYGIMDVDSYGWPAAMATRKLDETDTLAPVISFSGECRDYTIKFTELRNGKFGDNPLQIDQGVSEKPSILLNSNFDPKIDYFNEIIGEFSSFPPKYNYEFKLHVVDLYQDAKIIFAIIDRFGNIAIDSISYIADKIEIKPNPVDFGTVAVNSNNSIKVVLNNLSSNYTSIESIYLKKNSIFKFQNIQNFDNRILKPFESDEMIFEFNPIIESLLANGDIDSLIIKTKCNTFAFLIKGKALTPKIKADDWDAGFSAIGLQKCLTDGLRINNPGTMDLVITKIEFENQINEFSISDITIPDLPITIKPGKYIYLKTICFKPDSAGLYTAKLLFTSNAAEPKAFSILSGYSSIPGPIITNYNFQEKRVKTSNKAIVEITNKGSSEFTVSNLKFEESNAMTSSDSSFRIISITPVLGSKIYPENSGVGKNEKMNITIEFNPQSEHNIKIIHLLPVFSYYDDIATGSIYSVIEGKGILPKFETHDVNFENAVMVNTYHKNIKTIDISNPSTTAELEIKAVRWADINNNQNNDFEIDSAFFNFKNIDKSEQKTFNVRFKPSGVGLRTAIVEVIHDAAEGDGISSDEEFNPEIKSYIKLSGLGTDLHVSAEGTDFGTVSRCDAPISSIIIYNNSKDENLEITNIEVEPAFADIFRILESNLNFTILPGNKKEINVQFIPKNDTGSTYSAKVLISNSVQDTNVIISGNSFVTQLKLSMPILEDMAAGMRTNRDYKEFPIMISKSNHSWSDAKITKYEVEILYNPTWWKYEDIAKGNALPADWTVPTAQVINVSDTASKIVVSASGSTPISSDGELFKPDFWIMLSNASSFKPTFGSISFNDRDICVNQTNTGGEIFLTSCVQDLRNVIINTTNFQLKQIAPNPVLGESFNIDYSIGLDATLTRIELVNFLGETVKIIEDDYKRVGKYSIAVSTSELPSGNYTVRMFAGPYMGMQTLIIMK